MSGLNSYEQKQRRAQRRRNHIAKDLYTPKYGPRIRESKRQHLLDEIYDRELEDEYELYRRMGLTTKE